MERCPSGLRSSPGKRVYGELYRGFESPSLRQFFVLASEQRRGRGLRRGEVAQPEFVARRLRQRSEAHLITEEHRLWRRRIGRGPARVLGDERSRAGAPWIDVMRPSGRDFPLQPHFGVNRIANWSPSVSTTITTEGLPITSVGTVSHPTLAATNLAASMRRWRLTSAAVVDSVADQRSAGWACWRGNAAGLGGWTFVTRISLTTLQATGMGFFGLYGSTAALATTLTLAAAINCIGIGFQRGTHTRWQLVANDVTADRA